MDLENGDISVDMSVDMSDLLQWRTICYKSRHIERPTGECGAPTKIRSNVGMYLPTVSSHKPIRSRKGGLNILQSSGQFLPKNALEVNL